MAAGSGERDGAVVVWSVEEALRSAKTYVVQIERAGTYRVRVCKADAVRSPMVMGSLAASLRGSDRHGRAFLEISSLGTGRGAEQLTVLTFSPEHVPVLLELQLQARAYLGGALPVHAAILTLPATGPAPVLVPSAAPAALSSSPPEPSASLSLSLSSGASAPPAAPMLALGRSMLANSRAQVSARSPEPPGPSTSPPPSPRALGPPLTLPPPPPSQPESETPPAPARAALSPHRLRALDPRDDLRTASPAPRSASPAARAPVAAAAAAPPRRSDSPRAPALAAPLAPAVAPSSPSPPPPPAPPAASADSGRVAALTAAEQDRSHALAATQRLMLEAAAHASRDMKALWLALQATAGAAASQAQGEGAGPLHGSEAERAAAAEAFTARLDAALGPLLQVADLARLLRCPSADALVYAATHYVDAAKSVWQACLLPADHGPAPASAALELFDAERVVLARAVATVIHESRGLTLHSIAASRRGRRPTAGAAPPTDEELVRRAQGIVRAWLARRRLYRSLRQYVSTADTRRNKLLRELAATEAAYCANLNLALATFFEPLSREGPSAGLPERELATVFSNLTGIARLAAELRGELERRLARWPSVQVFGDVFVQLAPAMRHYAEYVANYERANATLQAAKKRSPAALGDLLRRCAARAGQQLTLEDYLVMPVQRMPRYEMLLKAILECTDAAHKDHPHLVLALARVQDVNQFINRRRGEHENATHLIAMCRQVAAVRDIVFAANRTLLRFGPWDVALLLLPGPAVSAAVAGPAAIAGAPTALAAGGFALRRAPGAAEKPAKAMEALLLNDSLLLVRKARLEAALALAHASLEPVPGGRDGVRLVVGQGAAPRLVVTMLSASGHLRTTWTQELRARLSTAAAAPDAQQAPNLAPAPP